MEAHEVLPLEPAYLARRQGVVPQLLLLLILGGCAHTARPGATAGAAVATVGDPRWLGGADCEKTSGYDVVIVGAGLAGFAAGRELAHLGRSILILEATERVGGRGFVGQIDAGGVETVPIDYGGAWIHGVPTNPLTNLVDRLGFERVRSELDVPFYAGGRQATAEEHELFNEAYEEYEEALSAAALQIRYEDLVAAQTCEGAEELARGTVTVEELCGRMVRSLPGAETSVQLCSMAHQLKWGGLTTRQFCAQAEEEIQVTSDVAASYLPQEERFASVLPLLTASAGPLETAAQLEKSSAFDAEGFLAGEDDLLDQGMGAFVQKYGEGLPVCLKTPVSRIEYGDGGVQVFAGGRRYQAEHALVTVSVGVLRAGKIAFEPPLPEWKQEAIEQLPMGHMQKVIVPFKEDIFPALPANSWVLVEREIDPAEQAQAESEGLDFGDERQRVMAFVVKPLGSNIAIGFYGGEEARFFEGQCAGKERTSGPRSASGCDDLAITAALRGLATMVGAEAVDRAILREQIHVTRWSLEPYTLGAYSVPLPGGWDQRHVLGRPLAAGAQGEEGPLRVFFAGEACSRTLYNGSYAGAFETGLMAAREIHGALGEPPPAVPALSDSPSP